MPSGPKSSFESDSLSPDLQAERDAARELEEVERAMAILQGKDPDELKRLREAKARAEANFKELADRIATTKARREARARQDRRRTLVRVAVVLVAAGAVGAFAHFASKRREGWVALDRALDKVAAPFAAKGFSAQRPTVASANRIEVQSGGAQCFIALAVTESHSAQVRAEHDTDVTSGDGSVAWCSCGPGVIAVTGTADDDAPVGIRLLGAPATVIGGSHGLTYLEPAPTVLGAEAVECSNEHLDAWIGARRHPPVTDADAWFEADAARAGLKRGGFRVVGRAPGKRPFVVANTAPDSCYVAMSSVPTDELSLRIDGSRPILRQRGPIAWCDPKGASASVWHEGAGDLSVVAAPARKMGGMLGLREWMRGAKIGPLSAWMRPEDLANDALSAIAASGALDGVIYMPTAAGVLPAAPRIVTFSVLEGGSITSDARTGAASACDPQIGAGKSESFCVSASAPTWRIVGSNKLAAGACGSIPFWMSALGQADDPRVVREKVELMRLARRLSAEGFEPTVLQGVTELPKGAEILGRLGEDAIVAVGISQKPPYLFPLTDGEAWAVDGAPHAIELAGTQKVTVFPVSASVALAPADRRTVVFRHHETAK